MTGQRRGEMDLPSLALESQGGHLFIPRVPRVKPMCKEIFPPRLCGRRASLSLTSMSILRVGLIAHPASRVVVIRCPAAVEEENHPQNENSGRKVRGLGCSVK